MSLAELLAIASSHPMSAADKPRIEGKAVIVPVDVERDGRRVTRLERARNLRELLDALGY